MRRLIEMIMSLIVVAATYAVMHVIIISDLFHFSKRMPAYVPAAFAVITGFIFYFIFSFNFSFKDLLLSSNSLIFSEIIISSIPLRRLFISTKISPRPIFIKSSADSQPIMLHTHRPRHKKPSDQRISAKAEKPL